MTHRRTARARPTPPRATLTAAALAGLFLLGLAATHAKRTKPQATPLGQTATAQAAADAIRPHPRNARSDRSQLYRDGCLVDQEHMRFPKCVYGNRSSDTTVVLFGDSKAMQYYPPMVELAHRHGWRLIGRTRAGCTPASIHYAYRCDKWRRITLRQIIRRDRPDLIVMTGATEYQAVRNGRRLGKKETRPLMRRGYIRTLRRLRRRTRAPIAVIKSSPRAPRHIPRCVLRHPKDLHACAFHRSEGRRPVYDIRAARKVKGARAINPVPVLCPRGSCAAVYDNRLVYRDTHHLTATYARTLAPWFDDQLPKPRRKRGKRAR